MLCLHYNKSNGIGSQPQIVYANIHLLGDLGHLRCDQPMALRKRVGGANRNGLRNSMTSADETILVNLAMTTKDYGR
jgi:hypothetical protein